MVRAVNSPVRSRANGSTGPQDNRNLEHAVVKVLGVMEESFNLTFSNGLSAQASLVHSTSGLASALSQMGLRGPRPTLLLLGGADGLQQAELEELRPLFEGTLAPLAQKLGTYVVDGGTDAGVMRLMGQARAAAHCDFPLIGVAAVGTVTLPDSPIDPAGKRNSGEVHNRTRVEPHHTHFVLVDGSRWGDESPWLTRTAQTLGNGAPSVTVLVNGGETCWEDVSHSVNAGRPVLVIAGTGRVADALAAALAGEPPEERAEQLAASGLLQAIALSESKGTLVKRIEEILLIKN
jgi:hypothetical protein